MLRNRKIVVTLDKKDKDQTSGISIEPTFERKTEVILRNLEGLGAKMFLGVCIYVILDTRRQVAVANAIYHPDR